MKCTVLVLHLHFPKKQNHFNFFSIPALEDKMCKMGTAIREGTGVSAVSNHTNAINVYNVVDMIVVIKQ